MFGWLKWLRTGGFEAKQEAARHAPQDDLVARILRDARTEAEAAGIGAKHTFHYVVRPEMSSAPLSEDVEFGLLIRAGQYGLHFEGLRDSTIAFTCRY